VCPDHHFLESWNDAEPVNGVASMFSLPSVHWVAPGLHWKALPPGWKARTAYDLLREHWEKEVFPRSSQKAAFQEFWDRALHDGVALMKPRPVKVGKLQSGCRAAVPAILGAAEGAYSLIVYSKVGMPDASHAYNAWLHELPDPMSKVTWDNYVCVSPASASRLGVTDGMLFAWRTPTAAAQAGALELPVFVQPGLHDQVVAVAQGYGSLLSKRFAISGHPGFKPDPRLGPTAWWGKTPPSCSSGWRGLCGSRWTAAV